jgi:hypothetical protein
MLRLPLAFFVLFATNGCSREEDKRLTVSGVTYTFPAEQVQSFLEPGEGPPFVRVRARGRLFDLIYSERAKTRQNFQGEGAPLVTTVNDHSSRSDFERFDSDGVITVCRGDHPYYGCGIRIEDNGVPWSIVFNRDQVPDAASIRAAALETLQKYRS